MNEILENEERLRKVLKSAIIEVLQERHEMVREILADIIEEIAFSRLIAEGENKPAVSRDKIFELLETAN